MSTTGMFDVMYVTRVTYMCVCVCMRVRMHVCTCAGNGRPRMGWKLGAQTAAEVDGTEDPKVHLLRKRQIGHKGARVALDCVPPKTRALTPYLAPRILTVALAVTLAGGWIEDGEAF